MARQPRFDNLLRVLDRQAPPRPTLFEFFLNDPLYARLANLPQPPGPWNSLPWCRMAIAAYARAGYDYTTVMASPMKFPARPAQHGQASRSMNDTAVITDRASFAAYIWPDPDQFDYSRLDRLRPELPAGMKLIVWGPGGVLENAVELLGYENLCLLLADDPTLVADVCDAVGSRLLRYYQIALQFDTVGAIISNDDWGFGTQTMISPDQLRRYVFPWHRRIAQAAHAAGRPAILHSCGQLEAVMDEVIDDLGFDGKHSYEDKITPVEEAYERWHRRIAILGGLDLDFVCRAAPAQVTARAQAMLDRSAARGGYALGTGNSVPTYVPDENYLALIRPVAGELGLAAAT